MLILQYLYIYTACYCESIQLHVCCRIRKKSAYIRVLLYMHMYCMYYDADIIHIVVCTTTDILSSNKARLAMGYCTVYNVYRLSKNNY